MVVRSRFGSNRSSCESRLSDLPLGDIASFAKLTWDQSPQVPNFFATPSVGVASMFSVEPKQRWHRLVAACLAMSDVTRAGLWASRSDVEASKCLGDVAAMFTTTFEEAYTALNYAQHRLAMSLRSSAEVYLKLYDSPVLRNYFAASSKTRKAAHEALRSAHRQVRDLITWRSSGLIGTATCEGFLEVLTWAFKGSLASDERELRSKMMQSWCKVRNAPSRSRRRGAKRAKNTNPLSPTAGTPGDDGAELSVGDNFFDYMD